MAAETVSSPKTSPQRPKGLFEVTIGEARRYVSELGHLIGADRGRGLLTAKQGDEARIAA